MAAKARERADLLADPGGIRLRADGVDGSRDFVANDGRKLWRIRA